MEQRGGRVKKDIAMLQPQHALPDVFLWIISGGKRQAYQRIAARDVIYSIVDEECGKECGKVQAMFLKVREKWNSIELDKIVSWA